MVSIDGVSIANFDRDSFAQNLRNTEIAIAAWLSLLPPIRS